MIRFWTLWSTRLLSSSFLLDIYPLKLSNYSPGNLYLIPIFEAGLIEIGEKKPPNFF